MSEDDFMKVTYQIFDSGIVWRVFLFHIARPHEYPIADKNVFRAFSTQKQRDIQEDWEEYMRYRDYFFEIAIAAGIIYRRPKGDEHDIRDIVSKLKKVDDALFAFGEFLSSYG